MAEEFNEELALELFMGICRDYRVELRDVVNVAGKLKKAEDLQNVAVGINANDYPFRMSLYGDYVGSKPFWKLENALKGTNPASDESVKDYFEDLGRRVGLTFQDSRHLSTSTPGINQLGKVRFCTEALAPSGKSLNVIVTQSYTYADVHRTT